MVQAGTSDPGPLLEKPPQKSFCLGASPFAENVLDAASRWVNSERILD